MAEQYIYIAPSTTKHLNVNYLVQYKSKAYPITSPLGISNDTSDNIIYQDGVYSYGLTSCEVRNVRTTGGTNTGGNLPWILIVKGY